MSTTDNIEAHPLLHVDEAREDAFDHTPEATSFRTHGPGRRISHHHTFSLLIALCISLVVNIFLGVAALRGGRPPVPYSTSTESVYSPAKEAIRTVRRKFSHLLDSTIYMSPPSNEVDQAWSNLYNFGVSRIPKSQAALLLNKTEPIPGDEENYIIALDVWHQLHCLNMIRQALHPDHYPEMNSTRFLADIRISQDVDPQGPLPAIPFDHIAHCINSIRESLMCSADITPNIWYWDSRVQRVEPAFDVVHECRDFDSVRRWAFDRKLVIDFNNSIHVVSE